MDVIKLGRLAMYDYRLKKCLFYNKKRKLKEILNTLYRIVCGLHRSKQTKHTM